MSSMHSTHNPTSPALNSILLTSLPAALEPKKRNEIIEKLTGSYKKVFSAQPGTARAHTLKNNIKDLSLLELAHFNTAIYQKIPFKAKNFQPIAQISDELFAADFSALPNIISTEISQRLTAKISSMSKKERKNLITSLAMIEGWSNDSGVHLRCAIRHIFNGRPHKLAEQITKNDPIRLLEVVRLIEEPLCPSFVFDSLVKDTNKHLRQFDNFHVGHHLSAALKNLHSAMRHYENFGNIEDPRTSNYLRRSDASLVTANSSLMAWRGGFVQTVLDRAARKERSATNAADEINQALKALDSGRYLDSVNSIRAINSVIAC